MAEIETKPIAIGDNRQSNGTFGPGNIANPNGRPVGTLSLVSMLKKKLEEIPEGEKISYADVLIRKYLKKAITEEDGQQQRDIIDRIDGKARQPISTDPDNPFIVQVLNYGESIKNKEQEGIPTNVVSEKSAESEGIKIEVSSEAGSSGETQETKPKLDNK